MPKQVKKNSTEVAETITAAPTTTTSVAVEAKAPKAKAVKKVAEPKPVEVKVETATVVDETVAATTTACAAVEDVEAAIAAKSYSIDWSMLLLTALVVIGYFSFLVRASDKELREVIDERFGPASTPHQKETP